MIKKHKYVSFLRYFRRFANEQINSNNEDLGLGSFAISLNNRANDLIVRAHFESIHDVYFLRQELLHCGREFIKKFVLIKKSRIFRRLKKIDVII